MRIQLFLSPEVSSKLCDEVCRRGVSLRELVEGIIKEKLEIEDSTEVSYEVALQAVTTEVDSFIQSQSQRNRCDDTDILFTMLDFKSFRGISAPAMRVAVGRGMAKHLKGKPEVEYLRDRDGTIQRTATHAAIYRIKRDININ